MDQKPPSKTQNHFPFSVIFEDTWLTPREVQGALVVDFVDNSSKRVN